MLRDASQFSASGHSAAGSLGAIAPQSQQDDSSSPLSKSDTDVIDAGWIMPKSRVLPSWAFAAVIGLFLKPAIAGPAPDKMGLQLWNKTPKRRVKAKLRSDRTTATAANDIWAMDFVHDQLFDGTKIRALTIIDTLSRLSPVLGVRQSYRGSDVVETLERGAAEFGYPKTIRVDNG